ncbi:uncharacterized protein N7484_001872 [Penicillium longicatenatum]|uniref:uncharacterized protein n=1 Tax=Penicillium longicatenatum TaxID=1561947 RepID=UPI002546FA13|nr:uncharacterized protein N7484_001872 [Penicillium longicatenatum]KAJ5658223.1 hypothetical protein N7484_001872 [Penicillium longicatenatum]
MHHVAVGGSELPSFLLNTIDAKIGDHIRVNHTLTQSSLKHPCSALREFDTGFGQFNPENRSDLSVALTICGRTNAERYDLNSDRRI